MPGGPLEILRARPGLAGWIATTQQTLRQELYFTASHGDVERRAEELGGQVTLFKENGATRGRSSFEIGAGREKEFQRDIDEALKRAALGGEPAWPIPGPGTYARVLLLDPEVRDTAAVLPRRARSEILAAVDRVANVRLAAAEVLVSKIRTGVVTSAGAAAENDMSEIEVEFVLLAGKGPDEQERLVRLSRRRYQDLDLPNLVEAEARRALDRLGARPPTPGEAPVLLSSDAFGQFFWWLERSTSGRAVYRKETPLKVGGKIAAVKNAAGEPLIVEFNAQFPYGPGSYRIDADGVPAQNVRVIDGGVFVRPHADAQYAAYLKLDKPTGRAGTPQLPPGSRTAADLRSGDHLEVVSFSDLVPSADGRFSAEIRMGYETRHGQKRAVAGGTLSGSLPEALLNAHFSKEVALAESYMGPTTVRVEKGLVAAG